jgi:transposase
MPGNTSANYDIATRSQILALKAANLSYDEIFNLTGIKKSTVTAIIRKAKSRGYDPSLKPQLILNAYVEDGHRSGRPTKQTEANIKEVLEQVTSDRFGREKTCAYIATALTEKGIPISGSTIRRIL